VRVKRLFARVSLEEMEDRSMLRISGQTIVNDSLLGLSELCHLRVHFLHIVGVFWMGVDLE
jgi:hypothetical protein